MLDLSRWLAEQGLGQHAAAFTRNAIAVDILDELTDADLRQLGLNLGDRKRLLKAIAALASGRKEHHAATTPRDPARRQLTIVFVDLVGSTALSLRLDPEEMRDILRAYQETVSGEVARFDGHIAKYMGDGILAYFGWPQGHEDDAERAVLAALASVGAVGRLALPGRELLAARAAVASGLVVVGDLVGQGAAREEAVVGETPNLAARLQELAAPGAVVIADSTRRLLGTLFELRALGPRRLKGFSQPVVGFHVLHERPTGSRFEAMRSGPLSAMVGRDNELALLRESWRRVETGEGQAVLLVGEAGIGKSRLVQAILDAVAGSEHVTFHYQCSPHHSGTALWPVVRQLAGAAGLAPGDADAARLEKLEALLGHGAGDVGEALPLIAMLLGVNADTRYPKEDLPPPQWRALTLEVLREHLLGAARHRPVLLVVEDTHWIDPTTLELIGQLVDRITGTRVLILLTSRPADRLALDGHAQLTRLTLDRLDRGTAEAIIDQVATDACLLPKVVAEIAARTDGVPLFIEELTRAVLESDPKGPRGTIPASLQATLQARLDRVPGVNAVAQIAACIGREFSYALLAPVSPLPETDLRAALDRLAAADLIVCRGTPPDAIYTFRHALVRDAAHESLLKAQRQQLHGRIASTLETSFPELVATAPELLAWHHSSAGSAAQAVVQWRAAATLAIRRSANLEAITHCDRAALELGHLPPSSERSRAEIELQLTKGVALRASKGYATPEAELVFSRACELCEEQGDRVRLVHALRGLWAYYYVAARWRDARRIADRLDRAAEGLDDPVAQAVREYVVGTNLLFGGAPAAASRRFQTALRFHSHSDRDSHIRHSGHDTGTLVRGHLMLAQWFLGLPEQALRTSDAGLEIARRVAHPFSQAQMLAYSAVLRALARDWAAADALASETLEVSNRFGIVTHLVLGTIVAGMATAALGRVNEGAGSIDAGLAALRRSGAGFFAPLALAHRALAHTASGDSVAALAAAAEAVRMARANEELCWEAETLRISGEVKLAAGTTGAAADAEADFRTALSIARRQCTLSIELRAAMSLARLWRDVGESKNAHDLLSPIYRRFAEGFDTPDLLEAGELLGSLGGAANGPAEASVVGSG